MNKSSFSKIIEKFEKQTPKNIEIYLSTINDLFEYENYESPDRRSIKKTIDEYLLKKAKEITINHSINLNIHLENHTSEDEEIIKKIIHEHYHNQAVFLFEEGRKKSTHWRIKLFSGIGFLALCHIASFLLSLYFDSRITNILQDSFEIMGWVAIWEPVLYFLFTKKEETYELSDYLQLEYATINIIQ